MNKQNAAIRFLNERFSTDEKNFPDNAQNEY